ncbi:hypothetical protein LCGC14_2857990 [marine sediment metagenome]|uniref:HTH cro/C1-type domain-containing protein n=1 Tax=marine sediment metagenome TaxID=412755 RepID=A0A0F8YTA6_9ZZZZ
MSQDGVISESQWHKSVDGDLLVKGRAALGLTQEEFALLCDHSRQFQSRIEAPGLHEVSVSKATEISMVLRGISPERNLATD